jgi:aminoglycoside phosphotransferase (APT) family kinase protein
MDQSILQHFKTPNAKLLGKGMEARVYALDEGRVLRIYRSQTDESSPTALARLKQFYDTLSDASVPFEIPKIYSIEHVADTPCTIDKRVYGTELGKALKTLEGDGRKKALLSYIQTAEKLCKLRPPYDYFGDVLIKKPLRTDSWPAYLRAKTEHDYHSAQSMFDREVPRMATIMDFIKNEIEIVSDVTTSSLVHGDYYVLNVLIDNDQTVSSVMDFNALVRAGDPRMDIASALIFFFEGDDQSRPGDVDVMLAYLTQKYGPVINRIIHLYRLYYAILFASFCGDNDPATFKWSIRTLKEHLAGDYAY